MVTKNTKKNAFTLRITDAKTLSIFDDLLATKAFESKNVLANKIIAFGIKDFAAMYMLPGYKSKQPTAVAPARDSKTLKQVKATTDDVHVMLMIVERMLATLYNTKALELQGEKVSFEEYNTGMLSDLPTDYEEMKDEIIRMRVRRTTGVDDE